MSTSITIPTTKYKIEKRIISEIQCAIFASTDPAYSLQYTLSGIIAVRSLLLTMLKDTTPKDVNHKILLNELLMETVKRWSVEKDLNLV